MKRAKKLISLVAALLMAMVALSACGGNEGGNSSNTEINSSVRAA